MSDQQPWWASGDDPNAVPTDDPLAAHTAARAGWRDELAEELAAAEAPPEPGPDVPHWLGDAVALVGRVATDMTQRLQTGSDGFEGEDPASRHPAGARRPSPPGGEGAHGSSGPSTGGPGRGGSGGTGSDGRPPHPPGEVCNACPFCLGLRALRQVRPEVIGHLSDAAHHLSLALRAVAEAAADGDDDVTRIPLDD